MEINLNSGSGDTYLSSEKISISCQSFVFKLSDCGNLNPVRGLHHK